jgi:beta-phosphoglucomutase
MTEKDPVLDAVFFDFDGVIVDSEPLHWEAFCRVLNPAGMTIAWDDYVEKYLGFDDRGVFREVFRHARKPLPERELAELIETKAQAFEELVRTKKPKPYPGAVELIRSLSGRVPVALCSGALKRDVTPILDSLGIGKAFDVMVTADDVHASKPDPASYLLAFERLLAAFPGRRIRVDFSVAIEDTPAGITAARGAGIRVVALANTYPSALLRDTVCVLESLDGITLRELGKLAALPG